MTYEQLLEENAQLRDAVKQLKHLQKYEGHDKAESDNLGHQTEINLLREEIARLSKLVEERDAQIHALSNS